MFTIKIADTNILIDNKYEYIKNMCVDYLSDEKSDFNVSVTDDEIEKEKTNEFCDLDYLESVAIHRKISEKIVDYNGFLMHAVVIDVNGEGIAFLGKSGVGKTTHAMLWKKYLGDKINIINGDKPIIRIIDEKCMAYGTPWAGKENFQKNTKTHLKKICFIEQAQKNKCISLDKNTVLEKLLSQIYKPESTKRFLETVKNVFLLIKHTDFYLLKCNTDISAAKVAYDALTKIKKGQF